MTEDVGLLPIYRAILVENELGGNTGLAYSFSDAGGRSGYSFGVCQHDLKHGGISSADLTPDRMLVLLGFNEEERRVLIEKRANPAQLSTLGERLMEYRHRIDEWDAARMNADLGYVRGVLKHHDIKATTRGFLAMCDYHNQFHLEVNGKCAKYMAKFNITVKSIDVFNFKRYHTAWGRKRQDDVLRRTNNIIWVCETYGVG